MVSRLLPLGLLRMRVVLLHFFTLVNLFVGVRAASFPFRDRMDDRVVFVQKDDEVDEDEPNDEEEELVS